MKADYESILFRIKGNPLEHLGRYDVDLTSAYMFGYEHARRVWGQPELPWRLDLDRFREWQATKVHLCNQNLQGFCRFVTDSEEDGLSLFFGFYESALDECAEDLVDHQFNIEPVDPSTNPISSLIDLLQDGVRLRPALYVGNRNWLAGIWSLCSGFLHSEADMQIENSTDRTALVGFQEWVEQRYGLPEGRNWARLYYFIELDSDQGSLDKFFEDIEFYLNGDPADVRPRWITEVVQNVLKQQQGED